MVSWLLLTFGILGALDALYFIAVRYRWMAPDASIIPAFCRMDEGSCSSIVHTRWGHVLGLPNAVYGFAWYVLIIAVAFRGTVAGTPWCTPLLIGAAATVAISVLLFWSLVWRLRVPCPLCFLGHGLNVAILVTLAWTCSA